MKKVTAYVLIADKTVFSFEKHPVTCPEDIAEIKDPAKYVQDLAASGIDEILLFDLSETDKEHHENLNCIRNLVKGLSTKAVCGGSCFHIDDVKKYLYTGADRMFFAPVKEKEGEEELFRQALSRFGADRCALLVSSQAEALNGYAMGFRIFYCLNKEGSSIARLLADKNDAFVYCDYKNCGLDALTQGASGLMYSVAEEKAGLVSEYKDEIVMGGFAAEVYTPAFAWSDFKLNSDGMLPVVVQDHENDEVLMVAYMNEDAYNMTVRTGRMTYYSRSRQELWVKGLTSGHFQYVKSLKIDCDNDTLLARVVQVGAACHTGNRSCFYRDIINRETDVSHTQKVLSSVYATIMDRKKNPREGSYTNYLFDEGLDKILKKVGEEAAEIIISAKNPDSQDLVYEMGDFLYMMMVLMAQKKITWEDVAEELANREG